MFIRRNDQPNNCKIDFLLYKKCYILITEPIINIGREKKYQLFCFSKDENFPSQIGKFKTFTSKFLF